MNYYESVVIDYLRADRAIFLNAEYCIQPSAGPNPDVCGPHWYCDAVALDLRDKHIYLCEISYEARLSALSRRLNAWNLNWEGVRKGIMRESHIDMNWPITPWLFIPQHLQPRLADILQHAEKAGPLNFVPRVTHLEDVQPWKYQSWSGAEIQGLVAKHS